MSEYWIHLEGLERLARQLRKDGKTSVITDRLIAYSSFLSVVASTTSMELPPIAWEDDSVDSSDLEDELLVRTTVWRSHMALHTPSPD